MEDDNGLCMDLAIGRDMEISMGGSWNFPIPQIFFFKTCAGFDVKGTKPSFRTFLVTYLLLKLE